MCRLPPGVPEEAQPYKPFAKFRMEYGTQQLWPDHCVQGTYGCLFHNKLQLSKTGLVVQKGFRPTIDSFSAFCDNDKARAGHAPIRRPLSGGLSVGALPALLHFGAKLARGSYTAPRSQVRLLRAHAATTRPQARLHRFGCAQFGRVGCAAARAAQQHGM